MSLHPKQPVNAKTSSNIAVELEADKPRRGCRNLLRGWFFKTILIILGSGLLIGIGLYLAQPRYYHILVIGSDQRNNEHARSDALMLISIPKSKNDPLSLVMVPRDTKVEDAEYGLQKMTHFYAMWDDSVERMGNVALTTAKVEELLDIKVNGTVEVTFDSFTDIVDTVGGVDISSGHVDGAEAQELIHNRFTQPDGDFGRAAEQREIFEAVFAKAKNPFVAKQLLDYMQTSDRARLTISKSNLALFGLAYVVGHRGISVPEFEEVVLPGEGDRIYTPSFGKSLYYWILDVEGTNEIADQYLR